MKAKLTIVGDDLLCQCDAGEQRIPRDRVLEPLQAQAKAYDNCLLRRSDEGLLEIGRTLFTLLDNDGWLSRWRKGSGARSLEIQVEDPQEPFALALLDAPWELLADASGYLVDDPVQGLQVVRRIGVAGDAWKPSWSNLRLMFMAAAPEGVGALQYEAEEVGILDATGELDASLLVEESGNAHQLGLRLAQDGPCEALHLSCHGNIDPKRGPVLALEDDVGEKALATVGDLMGDLGDPSRLPLVFLSACRSAETDTEDEAERPHEPLARELVRGGIANVLGWDGSVYDTDAKDFASVFYDALAHGRDAVAACAKARADLRQRCINGEGGDHWHLARLYVGPSGGGALVDPQQARHPRLAENAASEFLDTERAQSPVADRRSFVGRRRELRASLKALKSKALGEAGVLLHGMGNLGKSSLAARIAQRMTQHKTVVIFGRYDVLAVFDRLCNALPPEKRETAIDHWRDGLTEYPQRFAFAVEDLLENRLGDQAVLLIVDDLERILEKPQAGETNTQVKPEYRDMLRALLTVFARQRSASRLLLTSRFTFTLGDGAGGDLAQKLVAVPLTPMGDADRAKQWRILVRGDERDDDKLALLQMAALLAGGNPGLQAVLSKPVLSGEAAVALEAMESLQRFKDSGEKPPAGDALSEFFERMAFERYREALDEAQADLLRGATLFDEGLPIPWAAMLALGDALGLKKAEGDLQRLLGLGLMDNWRTDRRTPDIGVNALARSLVDALSPAEGDQLASAVLPALAQAWARDDGEFPLDERAEQAARLALRAAEVSSELMGLACAAAGRYLFNRQHNARRALDEYLQPCLARLKESEAPEELLMVTYDCAERLGEQEVIQQVLKAMEAALDQGQARPSSRLRLGKGCMHSGDVDRALVHFNQAAEAFGQLDQQRDQAIALGKIADILQACGQLDEALAIRQNDQLPVFERLGDVHSAAVTKGKIANILLQRGRPDEALLTLQNELLPVFERLKDVRSAAGTKGRIAEILFHRGQLDEALPILQNELLPVYERLGDVHEAARTKSRIADILFQRGQLDEALSIQQNELLPVFERFGNVREAAVTKGKIADILYKRGQLDEALLIRKNEQLPVFERLRNVREAAVTKCQIADILFKREQFDEALPILQNELLPVFERLGDVRSAAQTKGRIANILFLRGQLDEALLIRKNEELPLYERLGDVRSLLVAKVNISVIFLQRAKEGDVKEAVTLLQEALALAKELKLPGEIAQIQELLEEANAIK